MTDFNAPKDILGTRLAFVPGLYSLKQLKKMREKELVGVTLQSPSIPEKKETDFQDHRDAKNIGKIPFDNRGTYNNNEDSSDDDEISVISVKMAPKPILKQVAGSFETTLMSNFNVNIKSEQINEVNLPGKGLNQVKMDKKINNVDMFGGTFTNLLAAGNEKKVLDKQIMIENLRKELLNEAEQLEEKMISLNRQEKQISELNKMVECLTKEKEIYLKNENENKREMNQIKASFVERNLEIQELQNKVILLTKIRKQNENVIGNFKLSKNTSVEKEKEIFKLNTIINNLKTDLKVLPIREKRLEELQKEVSILSEKDKDLELLKTIVLPEKDKLIGNLGNKVIEMNKNDVEKKAIIDELHIKLNNSEKEATDSKALFWHTLGEKEKNIETIKERVTELAKNETQLETQLTEKIKDLSEKENFIVHLQQKVDTFIDKENQFNLKLEERNKEMLKKEEIIEYFEGKVNVFSKKEKEFEEFKIKLLDEKEQNGQENIKLIERLKELEQVEISLQFEKGKSCDLELRVTELTNKNNELQELNENYDLKVNSLRSELVEANISNMFETATHDSESERQLENLLTEKEDLIEQNNNLLLEISAKEKESVALQNESKITISSLESVINENTSKLFMQQEISNKLQEAIDELQANNDEKEKSTLDYNKWLENKLDEKRRLLTSTFEANKVLNKKYATLKTEKDDLMKEVRGVSDLQIKIKSLEEQLMNAREENGDEPGLIIDDQIDEPSTSRSAKLSLPSARDPRRKSVEARQNTSELMNSSSNDSKSSHETAGETLSNLTNAHVEAAHGHPGTYVPKPNVSGSSLSGEYQEQMGSAQQPFSFYSIFDIPASSPLLAPEPNLSFVKSPKSTLSSINTKLDVTAIPLSNCTNSTISATSHLNAGLTQLSTWMKKSSIKNLSDYKPLSVSVSPQKKTSPSKNVEEYSSSWSSHSPSGYEDTKRSRSHKRSRDYSRRERRISGQNYTSEKKRRREEFELKERSDWNVIPTKYLNFLTERKKMEDNLPGDLENVSTDLK